MINSRIDYDGVHGGYGFGEEIRLEKSTSYCKTRVTNPE